MLPAESQEVIPNPKFSVSGDILKEIIAVSVDYLDFSEVLQTGVIELHTQVANDVLKFFKESVRLRFPIHHVGRASDFSWNDEILMAENVSSGFNYRIVAGTNRPSLHSFGSAIDINPVQNPYIRYEVDNTITKPHGAFWDPSIKGTLHKGHPLVKLLQDLGWDWGGSWTIDSGRIDYQHFQKNH